MVEDGVVEEGVFEGGVGGKDGVVEVGKVMAACGGAEGGQMGEEFPGGADVEEIAGAEDVDREGQASAAAETEEGGVVALEGVGSGGRVGQALEVLAGGEVWDQSGQDVVVEVDGGGACGEDQAEETAAGAKRGTAELGAGGLEPGGDGGGGQEEQAGVDQDAAEGVECTGGAGGGFVGFLEEVDDAAGGVGDIDAVTGATIEGGGISQAGNAVRREMNFLGVEADQDVTGGDPQAAGGGEGQAGELIEDQVEEGGGIAGGTGTGQGGKDFSVSGVGGQATAVTAGVDQEDTLVCEEVGEAAWGGVGRKESASQVEEDSEGSAAGAGTSIGGVGEDQAGTGGGNELAALAVGQLGGVAAGLGGVGGGEDEEVDGGHGSVPGVEGCGFGWRGFAECGQGI